MNMLYEKLSHSERKAMYISTFRLYLQKGLIVLGVEIGFTCESSAQLVGYDVQYSSFYDYNAVIGDTEDPLRIRNRTPIQRPGIAFGFLHRGNSAHDTILFFN